MSKNIQIPEELFFELVRFHLLDQAEPEPQIKAGLMAKLDAMASREIYSKYLSAETPEEREKARQEYLNKRGISASFRW